EASLDIPAASVVVRIRNDRERRIESCHHGKEEMRGEASPSLVRNDEEVANPRQLVVETKSAEAPERALALEKNPSPIARDVVDPLVCPLEQGRLSRGILDSRVFRSSQTVYEAAIALAVAGLDLPNRASVREIPRIV